MNKILYLLPFLMMTVSCHRSASLKPSAAAERTDSVLQAVDEALASIDEEFTVKDSIIEELSTRLRIEEKEKVRAMLSYKMREKKLREEKEMEQIRADSIRFEKDSLEAQLWRERDQTPDYVYLLNFRNRRNDTLIYKRRMDSLFMSRHRKIELN